MSASQFSDQLLDLLAMRTTQGLSAREEAELERLLASEDSDEPEAFELAASALHTFHAQQNMESIPSHLSSKLRDQAAQFIQDRNRETPAVAVASSSTPILPWIVAIAASVVALLGWWPKSAGGTSPDQAMTEFMAQAPSDLIDLDWTATEDPSAESATGKLIWSTSQQTGFMTFEGFEVNDPSVTQYQLWIFDKTQEHPVDGGVFDIPSSGGKIVVPIDSKIDVVDPFQFAVTVERPGGVVVSKKERIALLAAIE